MPLTPDEFLAAVEADRIAAEASPPAREPDLHEALGEEIDRHPVGVPFCRSLKAARAAMRIPPDVDAEA